jgi:hypothetical protein
MERNGLGKPVGVCTERDKTDFTGVLSSYGTHMSMSYEVQSTSDEEVWKYQNGCKICDLTGELLSNGVQPCQPDASYNWL